MFTKHKKSIVIIIMRKINLELKKNIVERLKSGQSYREMAAEFGKSHNLIYKIKLCNNLEVNKPKSGRNKIFTPRDQRTIARLIAFGESKTAKDVTNLMNNSYGTHASLQTVNRELKRIGFRSRRKIKKLLLVSHHHQAHLNYAKLHAHMTFDDFYDWIWTDESKTNMFGSDGIRYTWRKPNSPLSARDFTPTVK